MKDQSTELTRHARSSGEVVELDGLMAEIRRRRREVLRLEARGRVTEPGSDGRSPRELEAERKVRIFRLKRELEGLVIEARQAQRRIRTSRSREERAAQYARRAARRNRLREGRASRGSSGEGESADVPLRPPAKSAPPVEPEPAAVRVPVPPPRPGGKRISLPRFRAPSLPRAATPIALGCVLAALGLFAGQRSADADPTPAGSPVPTAEESRYQAVLGKAIDGLEADRSSGFDRLRSARNPAAQAAASRQLAVAHARTAKELRRVAPSGSLGGEADVLAGELASVADAFDRLGAAAASGKAGRYRAANRSLDRADRDLRSRLTEVGSA